MSLPDDDDDDPRTELNVEVRASNVGRASPLVALHDDEESAISEPTITRPVEVDLSAVDDEPKTMEPRTLDPRLGIRPLAAAPEKAEVAAPPLEIDEEPSIQTVEARVLDAHKGVVRKIQKSPTIRGMGPEVPAAELDGSNASANDDVEDEDEDVTALDTSLLAGGLALAAAKAMADPATLAKPPGVGDHEEDDEPPTASVRWLAAKGETPKIETLPSTDLTTEPGLAKLAESARVMKLGATLPTAIAVPPRPTATTTPMVRVSKGLPDPNNRTLEMPRPAFVKAADAPREPVEPRGLKGTTKTVGAATGATPVSFVDGRSATAVRAPRGRGVSALAVTVLVAAAFLVGVLVTLFAVRRAQTNARLTDPPATSPVAATAEPPISPVSVSTAAAVGLVTSAPPRGSTSSSTNRTSAPMSSPASAARPPTKLPGAKSSAPAHL